ncbi:hypothetical protein ANN_09986 [Periplaneta americana]|uniref:Uncharacterized protein n=1 Tax=Periplaneta americana TaxID=6978 RepID=A0ABQ8TPX3_PERAM|nr:hypothetical protein ANN_09986 [Periplaneta americana]
MAGLCEGGNKPQRFLKSHLSVVRFRSGTRLISIPLSLVLYLFCGVFAVDMHRANHIVGEISIFKDCSRKSTKKRRIDKYRDIPPQNPDQFWDQVLATWEDFAKDQNCFRGLVDSMSRKCQAVIDAGGM